MVTPTIVPESPTLEQAAAALTEARTPVEVPVAPAPAANQPYTFAQNEDGTVQVQLQTGETFKGTALEVAQKLAESNANTHIYARNLKQEKQDLEQRWTQVQQTVNPPAPVEPQIDPAAQVMLDMLAPTLGYGTGAELKGALQMMHGSTEDQMAQRVASQFLVQNPDFPRSEQNSSVLYDYVRNQGLDEHNPMHYTLAHNFLKSQNAYQPVAMQPQQIVQPVRPNIPPVLGGTTPIPGGVSMESANEMPLEQLAALIQKARRQ